ncbi:hypothetical protein Hdeb2414_s0009g00313301 [Helianthus debilis subsp. tardiflorus]
MNSCLLGSLDVNTQGKQASKLYKQMDRNSISQPFGKSEFIRVRLIHKMNC